MFDQSDVLHVLLAQLKLASNLKHFREKGSILSQQNEQGFMKVRLDKTASLRQKGIDPYPTNYKRTHTSKQAEEAFESAENSNMEFHETIKVAGRIMGRRGMGKASFIDLSDTDGQIQIIMRSNVLNEHYEILSDLDIGDWIGAEGTLFRTRTGQITVQVESFSILCKSLRPLPEKWHGLTDVETRFRQRYLDLISNEDAVKTAKNRSLLIRTIRQFMSDRDFIEVETPMLVPIAAGGMAHPFTTHHNALNRDLFLRIATELHLKRLIVGGIEKVFEIGRVFRNEGVDLQHNPEFTTMESYEAFSDYNDVMEMVEQLVSSAAKTLNGSETVTYGDEELKFSPPWPRIDLRKKIIEVSGIDFFDHSEPDSLKTAMSKAGVDVSQQVSWSGLLDKLISDKIEPTLVQPCFLVDYPVAMSPLAKKSPADDRIAERFEGFVCGMEICNAFTELNDPIDQRERFEEQEMLRQEYQNEEMDRLDEDFLVAIEHGMPPTGGLGIGIDRLTMLLTNNPSIREVILFPQLRSDRIEGYL
jgi:lysyl-tRNA synthetase class 2|tara:strand:+ start:11836 stop:13425 length:1590 start_codon:yes stop_codon:yes gene_type:complete